MRKTLMIFRLWVCLACAVWLPAGEPVRAATPAATNAPNYFTRVWQVENGLPQNKLSAVLQTRDGYLWVATYSGLARFDGVRFRVYDDQSTPALRNSRITSLFEAADGALWIGHEDGEVTRYQEGRFQPVDIRASWAPRRIYAITQDPAGDIWLFNESGLLARVRDGLVLSPAVGHARRIQDLTRAGNGEIWVARDGALSILANGQLRAFESAEQATNDETTYIQAVCASRDGGVWINSNGRLRKWREGQWVQDLGRDLWSQSPPTCFAETRGGILLVGTSNTGLYLLFPGTAAAPLHINYVNGYQAEWITSVTDDQEGNIWVGTGGNGLVELRPSNIQALEPPDHWRGRALLTVCPARDGSLWIGTEGAGLYHYQHGEWTNFGENNGLANTYVWSMAEDAEGQVWAGTWGAGLFRRDGNKFTVVPGMDSMTQPIHALLPARDGGLWVGMAMGLLHYQDGRTNWYNQTVDGTVMRDVRTVVEDEHGAVWFGSAGRGLACLADGRLRHFGKADGLAGDYVECLHLDETGALWIGTFDGGLCRLKAGRFAVIDRAQGLPNNVIGDIEDDGNGHFWMSSHGGILRASKTELNECADGKIPAVRFLSYGVNDGLPTIECSEGLQPAGGKTPDGRLWFPTSKGLAVVSPDELRINPLPPPMALEVMVVDGATVTNLAAPLRIPPGRNRLDFYYTALSLVAPEKVRFKYRIEGLENDWVDAGTKRQASYSFVPPGSYTFHVIACNNDGVWNETGESLAFTLLPHFWQTWWFKVAGGLFIVVAASGLVWFETRRRMRRRLEILERQQAVERERARIAKDIHDDLGASLTRITMLSQSMHEDAWIPAYVTQNLERIQDTARDLTRSMDEIVWAVNPKHDTLDSLAGYLSRYAHDFLSSAHVRCRLDFPLQLPVRLLTAEVRHNLFLAFKESLHNVVRHAAAGEVCVALKLEANQLVLMVADNGRGFDGGQTADGLPLKPGRLSPGNGLANLRRRLVEIQGRCEVHSQPGRGTTVTFTVPLPAGPAWAAAPGGTVSSKEMTTTPDETRV